MKKKSRRGEVELNRMTDKEKLEVSGEIRGSRLKRTLDMAFPNMPRTKRARMLGVSEANLRYWEKGGNINNEVLSDLALMGFDIVWILTGISISETRMGQRFFV